MNSKLIWVATLVFSIIASVNAVANLIGTTVSLQQDYPVLGSHLPNTPFTVFSTSTVVAAGSSDTVTFGVPGQGYDINVEGEKVLISFFGQNSTTFDNSGTFNGLVMKVVDWNGQNARIVGASYDTNMKDTDGVAFDSGHFGFTDDTVIINWDTPNGSAPMAADSSTYFNVFLTLGSSGNSVPEGGATLSILSLGLGCVLGLRALLRKMSAAKTMVGRMSI